VKLTPTTHSLADASTPAGELTPSRDQLAPESQNPNSPQGRNLQGVEADIFRAMWAEDSPLTLRLLHQKTGIPVGQLTEVVAALHGSGRISRLNTVIESFVPKAAVDKGVFTLSLPPQHALSTTGRDTKHDGYISM